MNSLNNYLVSTLLENKTEDKTATSAVSTYQRLCDKEASLALVGLGYVGLPIALEFAKHFKVVGFDINAGRIEMMKDNVDPSGELQTDDFINRDITFTASPRELDKAEVIIVAVPTPVGKDNAPNLRPVTLACETIGRSLKKGNIVVFESTVYPGCTEEVCIPILESVSGLKYMEDFKVGYSPERINPGDKVHTLTNITKIVSGCDEEAEREIYNIYDHIIDAGIHLAPSIKVAEAAKIVENTQRDINIAFMNELSVFFEELNINTHDVLEAAGTKWNFLNFFPGLVGGHCIGVDPYYLIHKAKEHGMQLPVISSSRFINDSMPAKVVKLVEQRLAKSGKNLSESRVLVLGATFKENVTDLRNSKAAELAQLFNAKAGSVDVVDPMADRGEMMDYYGLVLAETFSEHYDAVVYAVNHKDFEIIDWSFIEEITTDAAVVFDFKRTLTVPREGTGKIEYLTL